MRVRWEGCAYDCHLPEGTSVHVNPGSGDILRRQIRPICTTRRWAFGPVSANPRANTPDPAAHQTSSGSRLVATPAAARASTAPGI